MTEISDVNDAAMAGKFLTFKLDEEEYGLEILKVQEIIGILKVTRIPKMPAYVRGVINLRGKVIPVIDLREKFNLEQVEFTDRTCIVVLQVSRGDRIITMGVIVDEVSEVADIAGREIEEPPSFGTTVDASFLVGIGKLEERVVLILDVDKVLSGEELALLDKATSSPSP